MAARGPLVRHPPPEALRGDRADGGDPGAEPRARGRRGRRGPEGPARGARHRGRASPAGRSTSGASTRRWSCAARSSTRSTTWSASGSSSTRRRTAGRPSARSTPCGRRSRAASRTTSTRRSSTSTSRCTPRSSARAASPSRCRSAPMEMHRRAEYGIAAHWGYKEDAAHRGETSSADEMQWLQRIVDWERETPDPIEFLETLKLDLEQDEVYVFTPERRDHRPADGVDADRLRLRDPHRGRPPLHRRARSTRSSCRSTRSCSRRDTVEIFTSKFADGGPVARLAEDRRLAQGAQQDPPVVLAGSAARTPSRTAATSWPRSCGGRACRCDGCSARARSSGWPSALGLRRPRRALRRDRRGPPLGARRRAAAAARAPRRGRGAAADDRPAAEARRPVGRLAERRRLRRGPRRHDGPPARLLHPGAGRPDRRASSPGAAACRSTAPTAPTPLSLAGEHRERLIEVEWDAAPGGAAHRGHRGEGARPLGAARRRGAGRSPSTTSTSSQFPPRPRRIG